MHRVLAILLLAACTTPAPQPACEAGMHPVREVTAFFGRQVTQAGTATRPVTEAEWHAFLAAEIAPRFPNGSTVTTARGTWRHPGTGATITEDSAILLLILPEAEAQAALAALRAAADAYRRRHAQDAVGIVARRACASGFS